MPTRLMVALYLQAMRQGGCGMEARLLDPTKAKESRILAL
jgi:hypothetical protein